MFVNVLHCGNDVFYPKMMFEKRQGVQINVNGGKVEKMKNIVGETCQ